MVNSREKKKEKNKIERDKDEKNEGNLFVFGGQRLKKSKNKKMIKKLDNLDLFQEKSDKKRDLISSLFEFFEDEQFKENVFFGESFSGEKSYINDSGKLKKDFLGYESLYDSKYSQNNYDEKKASERKNNYSFFEKNLEDFSDRIKPYKLSVLDKGKG